MGSLTFDGVRFSLHSDDHPPPHAHGRYNGVEVVVDLYDDEVALSGRRRNILPAHAKRADVQHILRVAYEHRRELLSMWSRIDAISSRR